MRFFAKHSIGGYIQEQEFDTSSNGFNCDIGRFCANTGKAPFRYRLKDGKDLEIVESEARLIRWIFGLYLTGVSTPEIAKRASGTGVRTRDGRTEWNHVGINYILRNEKYIGDALCQKTLATDDFPFTKKRNEGEKDQYYVDGTHPAIISKDALHRVQKLLEFRGHRPDGP